MAVEAIAVFRKRDIQTGFIVMALASVVGFALPWYVAAGLVIVSLVVVLPLRRSVLIAMCCLGFFRGWLSLPPSLPSSGATIQGVVSDDPVFDLGSSFRLSTSRGTFDVRSRSGEVRYADRVNVICTEFVQTSRFKVPRCTASTTHVLGHNAAPIYGWVLHDLKSWLTTAINHSLPSPEAPLLSGILLGSRSQLPVELANAFRTTGTSHIVAVSGFNVTVVIALIAGFIGRLPIPRRAVTVLTIVSIVGFVILTGGSASVVRAGIMGGLAVLARATGRLSDALHSLIVSSSAMVIVQPATMADVGFQLSVAATAGLVLLSEPMSAWLWWVPERLGLRDSMSTTLAAIIVTEPVIALTFGRVSLIALLVNIFVLPLVPISMGLGFGVALLSGLAPVISPLVAWAAWLPLTLMVRVVEFASHIPYASVALGLTGSIAYATIGVFVAVSLIVKGGRVRHAA